MAQYHVDVTEDVSVEVDLAPGAPALTNVELVWHVSTEEELREAIVGLGFAPEELNTRSRLQTRTMALRRDGERVGSAGVQLWLDEALLRTEQPPIPAVVKIREEARNAEMNRVDPSAPAPEINTPAGR
jgi:hypothetical protein